MNKITPEAINKEEIKSGGAGKENDLKPEASIVTGKARVKMLVIRLAGAKDRARYQVKTYQNRNALTTKTFSQLAAVNSCIPARSPEYKP